MKNIKFLMTAVFMLSMSHLITSCNDVNVDDRTNNEPEYYTITLGFDGEIEVDYEPLVRTSETNDLYGIQIFSTPKTERADGEEVIWTRYAYGLFDTVDNLIVNLIKGYEYKFIATMVKDGKEKLYLNGGYSNSVPFNIDDNATRGITNKFIYGQMGFQKDYWGLKWGYSQLTTGYYFRPNTERYYGELEGYVPSEHNNKAKIKMKRTSFGAKVIAQGKLATSGILEIIIQDAPRMELDLTNGNQISEVFTFYYVYDAWANDDYSENIAVSFNYFREDGSMLPLGTHEIVFKRNSTTVVKMNIENEGEDSEIGIELTETGEMEENPYTETTITDGERVDTEVGTNA